MPTKMKFRYSLDDYDILKSQSDLMWNVESVLNFQRSSIFEDFILKHTSEYNLEFRITDSTHFQKKKTFDFCQLNHLLFFG